MEPISTQGNIEYKDICILVVNYISKIPLILVKHNVNQNHSSGNMSTTAGGGLQDYYTDFMRQEHSDGGPHFLRVTDGPFITCKYLNLIWHTIAYQNSL